MIQNYDKYFKNSHTELGTEGGWTHANKVLINLYFGFLEFAELI